MRQAAGVGDAGTLLVLCSTFPSLQLSRRDLERACQKGPRWASFLSQAFQHGRAAPGSQSPPTWRPRETVPFLLLTLSLASILLAEKLGAPGTLVGAPTFSVHLPRPRPTHLAPSRMGGGRATPCLGSRKLNRGLHQFRGRGDGSWEPPNTRPAYETSGGPESNGLRLRRCRLNPFQVEAERNFTSCFISKKVF